MPWPNNVEYNEAIQNPRTAFADPELRFGNVERDGWRPKARSGNMATVYRMETAKGPYAVRFFLRQNPESSLRYTQIYAHFAKNPLPYMVGFQFITQGIRVGREWYPIVKMQWVEGIALPDFIRGNLSSSANLHKLASEWVAMLAALRRVGIAHGDLQHGNVLMVQGRLRLVDYDGCYVPGLQGKRAIELGHLNYQHPRRSPSDFGPDLDNFSAWLIYLSIIATAGRPALWKELGGGDECLLFRKADLQAPQRSEAFHFLSKHPDERVRVLSQKVRSFLNLDLAKIPPVFDYLTSPGAAELRVSPLITAKIWLDDRFDFSSRLEAFKRSALRFLRQLPGWLFVAGKFVGKWALRIAIFLLIMLWRFLVWFFRFLGRLFLAAVDRWGVGQVMLTIGGFILGTALLFQLWSCVHRTAAKDVSRNTPRMYFVPQTLLGRWTGSGLASQANRGKIQIQISLGQRYMSRIVGTPCLATLSLVNSSPQSGTFVEHFQQPGPLCIDDTITLDYRGPGHLHFSKAGMAGTWQGELWRMQVPPRRNK